MVSSVFFIIALSRCYQAPWHPIDCPADMQSNILEFNSLLASQVKNLREQHHLNISFHDPNCLDSDGSIGVLDRVCDQATDKLTWEEEDYFTWGIHFSEQGYAKMAAAWHKALSRYW